MSIVFDHTIVPSRNKKESAEFYSEVLGFKDLGEQPDVGLRALRVNASTILFLEKSTDADSSPWSQGYHHYAFGMSKKKFEQVFTKIKAGGIPYGESYDKPDSMKGPGTARGARGTGKTIYVRDPSDNLLQIICY